VTFRDPYGEREHLSVTVAIADMHDRGAFDRTRAASRGPVVSELARRARGPPSADRGRHRRVAPRRRPPPAESA
jgi:hypothetical protein